MVDPITILSGIKLGLQTGKSVAGLSKQIGQFFDATDAAKKTLQKKGISGKSVNATALDRWAKVRQAAEAEAELQEWITQRRDAIQRQELMITIAGITVLLIFTFIFSVGYLHWMNWIDVRDYFP